MARSKLCGVDNLCREFSIFWLIGDVILTMIMTMTHPHPTHSQMVNEYSLKHILITSSTMKTRKYLSLIRFSFVTHFCYNMRIQLIDNDLHPVNLLTYVGRRSHFVYIRNDDRIIYFRRRKINKKTVEQSDTISTKIERKKKIQIRTLERK